MTSTPDSFLFSSLRAQLEFYFSPQNLARDVYLRNLLNSYGYNAVPLQVIANFPKVRALCNGQIDLSLLMRSVEGSRIVSVTADAVWICPLLPIPPLDTSKQPRSALTGGQAAPQPPQQNQQQQVGPGMKVGEGGDGSVPVSASSSQNSLTAIGNGYVNENGGYSTNNATTTTARSTDSSRTTNQSQHPTGQNSLPDTPLAQLPPQPTHSNPNATLPHQQSQPQPTHPTTYPYPAAPIPHPSHGATTYAYPQYTYRQHPLGSAGATAYHHPPHGGYSYPASHMVQYQLYGYPSYVQNNSGSQRGYFPGGRGSGDGAGQMGSRPNGEGDNGGLRRGSSGNGKGGTDGGKKSKGKVKKVSAMQNYQHQHHHGADQAGNTNHHSYGGLTQQQHQQSRWKSDRGDSGGGSSKDGNDSYGKHAGRNQHHNPRGTGKYDAANWDRMNRSNNRSQNDMPPSTDGNGRIGPGDTFYTESNNPLARVSGAGPLHTKSGGNRKKKSKRREGDNERRKDPNLALSTDDRKREIFDANSFPALSPSKNEITGGSSGSNQPKFPQGIDNGGAKMAGYADALKQTTKSSRPTLIVEQPPLTSSLASGPLPNDKLVPQTATITTAVVTPSPIEKTTTTTKDVEDAIASMAITPTSLDGPLQPKELQAGAEGDTTTTTIAVGALTGMPTTTTDTDPKTTTTCLETNISASPPPMGVSPSDVVPNARQSKTAEPTPREASHSVSKSSDQDVSSVGTEGDGGCAVVVEIADSSTFPSSPPSVWGNKRSWIDVARNQS